MLNLSKNYSLYESPLKIYDLQTIAECPFHSQSLEIGREFERVLSGHLFILSELVTFESSSAVVCHDLQGAECSDFTYSIDGKDDEEHGT